MRKLELSLRYFCHDGTNTASVCKTHLSFRAQCLHNQLCSASSSRPHWSGQHRPGQFRTQDLFHVILLLGQRTCPPLAPPAQEGTAFLEWHLKNNLITTRKLSSPLMSQFSFVPVVIAHFSTLKLLRTLPVKAVSPFQCRKN